MTQLSFNVIVGVLIRSAVMMLAGWLAGLGLLPSGSVDEWGSALALVLLTVAWSLYEKAVQKAHTKLRMEVALAAPAGSTEEDVEAIIEKNREVS